MYSKVARTLLVMGFAPFFRSSINPPLPIAFVVAFGFANMRHRPDFARARIIAGWDVCEIHDHPNPLHTLPIYALIAFPIPTP
jgi:hypothetical protein